MPEQQQVGDTVVIIIVLSALAIGLGSMLIGRAVEAWDRFRAWWKKGLERERSTRLAGASIREGGSGASSDNVVLPQQHQPAPELVLDFEAVLDYVRRHNLSDDQVIDLLALIHRESGDLLSANKIRDIAGGNEATVKARVARLRPKPPAPKPSPRLERPVNGW